MEGFALRLQGRLLDTREDVDRGDPDEVADDEQAEDAASEIKAGRGAFRRELLVSAKHLLEVYEASKEGEVPRVAPTTSPRIRRVRGAGA